MEENKLCRLCLTTTTETNFGIFDLQLQDKILKYCNLEILPHDMLPKFICLVCVELICKFDQFVQKITSNQLLFVVSPTIIPDDKRTEQPLVTAEYHHVLEGTSSLENTAGATTVLTEQYIFENHQTNASYLITEIEMKKEQVDQPGPESPKLTHMELTPFLKPKLKRSVQKPDANAPDTVEEPSVQLEQDFNHDEICADDETDDVNELDGVDNLNSLNMVVIKDFPDCLMKNGRLMYKGDAMFDLISKFYTLECDLCKGTGKQDVTAKSYSDLMAHFNKTHSIKGYVHCCGSKLISVRSIALHMARHINPNEFQCDVCFKFLTDPKILEYHRQNHLPEEQRPLQCPYKEGGQCPRRFSYSSALVAHTISHLPESERYSHVCDECGKIFGSSGRLSSHHATAHTKNGQKYVCHICAKEFNSKGNLIYHLTTHQAKTINQVECPECGKWLKNKLCLRKHQIQHSKVVHKCPSCDYSAVNPQCLRNHIKVKHSDVKAYSCQFCDKTFKLKNTLINHEVQHTGIKRYKCQFCSRTFASSGNFYSHRKRIHSAELAAFNIAKEEEEQRQRLEHAAKRSLAS